MEKKIIIAIDGVVASGKGTLARLVAQRLGYIHIDTGAMYRALTLVTERRGIDSSDESSIISILPEINISFQLNKETGKNEVCLDNESVEHLIRTRRISKEVPFIAHIPKVREFTRELQHNYAKDKGIVLDGRDIGTTVFPEAELKIFLVADPEVRAERRHKELRDKGQEVSFESILEDLNKRDLYDTTAEIGRLEQAKDAILIDSTNLSIPEVVDIVTSLAEERIRL